MKYYYSDVTSRRCFMGSRTNPLSWHRGLPLCFLNTVRAPLLNHFQPRHRSSSELRSLSCPGSSQYPKSVLSPIILCSGSGGKNNQHHLVPPACPHITESLRGISCYDPICQMRTLRLWAVTWPIRVETSVAVLCFSTSMDLPTLLSPGPILFSLFFFNQMYPWHLYTPHLAQPWNWLWGWNQSPFFSVKNYLDLSTWCLTLPNEDKLAWAWNQTRWCYILTALLAVSPPLACGLLCNLHSSALTSDHLKPDFSEAKCGLCDNWWFLPKACL